MLRKMERCIVVKKNAIRLEGSALTTRVCADNQPPAPNEPAPAGAGAATGAAGAHSKCASASELSFAFGISIVKFYILH